MITPFLILPLAAVFQTGQQGPTDQAPDRKVRIEIVTTENGETRRVTKEFDATDEAQLQDALRELGVFDHLTLGDGEGDLTIDIRGFGEGNEEGDMFLHMAPMAPMPPMAPLAIACGNGGFLGVSTMQLSEELRAKTKAPNKEGAYVIEVVDGSAAAALGLKEGDVITAVEGEEVDGPEELTASVREHEPGEKVKLTWYRDGKKMTGTAELGKREERSFSYTFSDGEDEAWAPKMEDGTWQMEQRAFLGVTPAQVDGSERAGAVISSVEVGSAAERMGLQPGDAIRSINGIAISDFDMLAETIRGMKPGDAVTVVADRDGRTMNMTGELGERKEHRFIHVPGMGSMQWENLDPEARDELRREMDQLRREMNEMRREMGREIRREVRVNVEARKLTEEEKAMLRGKGVAVGNELVLGELQAFPNPSNGFYRLQFDVPERGDLNVDVHDAKGERVYQERIVGFKGRYERTLDLSDQATGSYFLVISQGGRATTHKLVKE